MVTATQSSHKGYDGVLRVLENPKRRVCRCGLKLRYGVAEHWGPGTGQNGKMFGIGAQNPLPFRLPN